MLRRLATCLTACLLVCACSIDDPLPGDNGDGGRDTERADTADAHDAPREDTQDTSRDVSDDGAEDRDTTSEDGDVDECDPTTCVALGAECGQSDDGCGGTLDCGSCESDEQCGEAGNPNICVERAPLAYPNRSAYRIKSIQPDFWSPKDEISGNNTGGVAMNLVWSQWESSVNTDQASCTGTEKVWYDGHCFQVHGPTDDAIKEWTNRGLIVTGVLYGVPSWARAQSVCSPISPGFAHFCSPDDPADYARFVGMIAERYDGQHGHGRIADFVIHNEVNSNVWFDVGCGQGTACDTSAWIQEYADNFNAAYDAIVAEQSTAKVLISLTHHFGTTFDRPSDEEPLISGETFLSAFAGLVGDREWRVAYHPYPPDLRKPGFSADDYPKVTYGNVGVIVGWLRKNFPNDSHAWDVQLTESGVNSISPYSSEAAQARGVCDSFRNVLGTPWISNYVYHRMKDHPDETAGGLGLGLRRTDGTAKPAWSTWATANRNDLQPPQLDCGFEDLPHTILTRYYHTERGHWASTRLPPNGFQEESSWKLFRESQSGTRMLFECAVGEHNIVTTNPNCEGQRPMGPVGFIYTSQQSGTQPVYRCNLGGGADHFISSDPGCEGQTRDMLLGYAEPAN